MKKGIQVILCGLLMANLNGCVVHYTRFPKEMSGAKAPAKKYGKSFYRVEGVSMAGGYTAIQEAFKRESPFRETEYAESIPPKGFFVWVKVKNRPPSIPSLIFGYISLGTFTFLPAWTTKGGTQLVYEAYQDGHLVKTFDYDVRRIGFLWIVMLPLAWINLFTPSENEAFRATAMKFFDEGTKFFPAP